MVKITTVYKHSLADRVGIMPHDNLISINSNEINDVLDYRFYLTESHIDILVERDGENLTYHIDKGEYDDIGLDFETPLMDKKHTCRNGCIFCFIDQNPEGLRETLYFKDDDSRLSFLHGNYITLTNMTKKDVERIVKMRFSPINISVHTTNPQLRVKMMKNKRAGEVLSYLDDFKAAGLSMCAQIVLCRGVNDGEELIRTITDLRKYSPELTSIAVVPAGLTKFRDKLYPLTDFTRSEACQIIDTINELGEKYLDEIGTRLVFPADEFYLKAEREIPKSKYYEEYSQLENGVGMIRLFEDELGMAIDDARDIIGELSEKRCVSVVTGVASYPMIKRLTDALMSISDKLDIRVYEIINHFFGESITVSGLLTGKDICEQLRGKELGQALLIPLNSLRQGEDVFLCGMTTDMLSRELNVEVCPSGSDGYEFLDAILGLDTDMAEGW